MYTRTKHILPLFLLCIAVFALALCASAQAYRGACGDYLTYTLDEEDGILNISGHGEMWDYKGGSYSYDNAPWYYFRGVIRAVSIADGVTHIGRRTFYDCMNLKSISIPDSVTSIGGVAFADCNALCDVYIADLTAWCQLSNSSLFSRAYNLHLHDKLVTDLVIPDSVRSIRAGSFYNCSSLISLTVPNHVTSIGKEAFYGCRNLFNITISDGVTSIGADSFYNTAWLNRQPDGVVYAGKMAYTYKKSSVNDKQIVLKPGTTGIADGAFFHCENFEDIIIPSGVINIGSSAFSDCDSITSIVIPDSVEKIGNGAFWGCAKLTSVIIPGSVTSIGECAFIGCDSLENIIILNPICEIYDYEKTLADTATILGFKGSSAESYAEKYNRNFVSLGEAHIHAYAKDFTVDVSATCSRAGVKSRHCTASGCMARTDTTVVPTTGLHDYAEEFTIDVPATCTAVGTKSRHCKVEGCDAQTDITEIPKAAHTYVDGVCKDCGKVKPAFIPGVVTGEGEKPAKRDLLRLQKYLAGWDVEIDREAADCNGDGQITKADLLRLQKYLAGWDVKLGE